MNQLDARQLSQHVTLVAWLQILSNALSWLAACGVFILLAGIGVATGDDTATSILVVAGTVVGAFLFILAIPGIIAGYGLLRRQNWGRYLGLIVGLLQLVNFPLGTLIGGYTLWVLLQDSAEEFFGASQD